MFQLSKRTQLILFTIPLLLSCQLTSLIGSEDTTENPLTQPVETEVVSTELEVDEAASSSTEEPEPTPTSETATNSPPALPSSNVEKEVVETSGSIVFQSPAGYELTHFADWIVADYFGQTIITNNEATLENGGALVDQPILIIASGDTQGQSAPGILSSVHRELLNQGRLVPVSPVIPLTRPSGKGLSSQQRILLPEGNIDVISEVLINDGLYTVAIGLLPENTSKIETDSLSLMMESVTLVKGSFDLTKSQYGFSPNGMNQLNQILFQVRPVPEPSKELVVGQTQASVAPTGGTILTFSITEPTTVNLTVIPANVSFDVTVDLLAENNSSLLSGGNALDAAGAGDAERIQAIPLEPGNYRLLVRGFALTGGAFTVEYSN